MVCQVFSGSNLVSLLKGEFEDKEIAIDCLNNSLNFNLTNQLTEFCNEFNKPMNKELREIVSLTQYPLIKNVLDKLKIWADSNNVLFYYPVPASI